MCPVLETSLEKKDIGKIERVQMGNKNGAWSEVQNISGKVTDLSRHLFNSQFELGTHSVASVN